MSPVIEPTQERCGCNASPHTHVLCVAVYTRCFVYMHVMSYTPGRIVITYKCYAHLFFAVARLVYKLRKHRKGVYSVVYCIKGTCNNLMYINYFYITVMYATYCLLFGKVLHVLIKIVYVKLRGMHYVYRM